MKKILYFMSMVTVSSFMSSCADLEIENPNQPNLSNVLKSAADVANLPGGAFVNWHQSTSTVNAGPAIACNADILTCSWGNFGIRNFSWQPPIPVDNSLTSNDGAAIRTIYNLLYTSNSLAMDVERYVNNPDNIPVILNNEDITARLRSVALFLEGVSHGYISISYNQGFIADASTDLGTLNGQTYSSYQAIRDFAVDKLEEAAEIAEANEFELPSNYISGLTLDNVEFAKLCRTVAAQVLVLNARNATENTATDWARVLANASNGLDFDFAPIGDDNLWFDDFKLIGGGALANGVVANTWARTDVKVMNLMSTNGDINTAPSYTDEYPATGIAGPVTTNDDRLASDFLYRETVFYPADRGRYRFSNYVHNRYAATSTAWAGKPMVKIMKAENDLMWAEALIRTGGNKITAAALINNTRVGRGGLTPLTGAESNDALLYAIKYEKIVELMNTWGGRELAEVRRWGGWLREGAFEQLPVPGQELTLLGVPIYTFGGVQ